MLQKRQGKNGMNNIVASQDNGALIEKVVLKGDLSGLSPQERVVYINKVCESLKLNPLTNPIAIMEFHGKVIPYFRKESTEQLRQIHNISINKLDKELLDGGLYVVTAYASDIKGKSDSSTGVISISNLKGEALANAMMKAETKAKRRVTLSICGLGYIDESEIDFARNDSQLKKAIRDKREEVKVIDVDNELDEMILSMSQCDTLESLQNVYKECYKILSINRNTQGLKKLMDAKDNIKEKMEETIKSFNAEIEEIKNDE